MSAAQKSDERGLGLVVIGDAHLTLSAGEPFEDAPTYRRTLGGDALLTAIVAARAGVQVALVTRVGEDDFTDWMLQTFEAERLHLDYTRQVAGPNPVMLLGTGRDGRQSARYVGAGSAVSLDPSDLVDIPWDLARLVFVPGSLQALGAAERQTAVVAFETARAAGVRTVYDPTLVPGQWAREDTGAARAAFEAMLPHTDVLIIGAPYAAGKLLGRPLAAEAAREALHRGVSAAVVRHSDGSVIVADARGAHTIAAEAGADGPGDASRPAVFDGALVAALAKGFPLVDAAALASAADRAAPLAQRDLDSLPSREAIRAHFESA
ncbi:MAG: PfkB family carbohydrate kinase [Myxococcota bacterium]